MTTKTSYQKYDAAKMARAAGKDLSISTKDSIEIGNVIRYMDVDKAKAYLEKVVQIKQVVPMRRFNRDTGHKHGPYSAGRYPVNAAKDMLAVLKSAEANAKDKGLSHLYITHVAANRAAGGYHHGRQRGVTFKRSHLEIVVRESTKKGKQKDEKSGEKLNKAAPAATPEQKQEKKSAPQKKKTETKRAETPAGEQQ
ncbi:50S ribosomal protein L22 [Candidatus Woesearchaeota archaeon]|nr:50S ribosomal protein L22 [Candidatus Woesearchaeota archaeon]